VVSTLAVFNLLGMQLSTAGVAAFLMLIGYSIDTDILLSSRLLRGESNDFIANLWSAAKTGLTMQITTAVAVIVVLIFSNNAVFTQIMTIIFIGMFFDVLYTWIQNAANCSGTCGGTLDEALPPPAHAHPCALAPPRARRDQSHRFPP
jgi:preprotein translocase subunit SecF